MTQLPRKELYDITLKNLAPPYLDYEYFKNSAQLPFRYAANAFDMVNAWWLIEAATLVYADKEFVTEKFKKNAGLPEVKYFSGKSTQCFVAANEKFAIVAFRGSEARLRASDEDPRHIIADWMADLDFLPVQWNRGGKVHRGFREALQEVGSDIEDYISDLRKHNLKIWLTGHSLGAALATLAADCWENIQGLYTYGSPRVGDAYFRNNFKVKAYRFVNNRDIIAKMPPAGIYRHVGDIRYIDGDGVIHDNVNHRSSWTDEIQGQLNNVIHALRQNGKGLTGALFEPIVDHVPTLYAIHIWNNLVSRSH
jgi:triacylglycerol lipase